MSFDSPQAYESWLNEQLRGTGLRAEVKASADTGPWWAAVCGAWHVMIRSNDLVWEYSEMVLPEWLPLHAKDWVKDWVKMFEIKP